MVASDRISTYDVVHPTAIPDKGKVLTGLSALWFDLTKDIVANHVISYTDGVPARASRPRPARQEAADAARGVRRARLHLRLRLEGLPGDRLGLGDRAARGAARVRPPPGADLHALDEGRGGPRRGDRLRGHGRAGGLARAGREAARHDARRLRGGRRVRARARRDPRRHEVRVRPRRGRRAGARRRGLHAGLLALLAGRPVRAGQGPAELRQAVRARLGRRAPAGTRTPPAPAIPDEVVAATRERYVTAYERLAGEPFSAWLERTAP